MIYSEASSHTRLGVRSWVSIGRLDLVCQALWIVQSSGCDMRWSFVDVQRNREQAIWEKNGKRKKKLRRPPSSCCSTAESNSGRRFAKFDSHATSDFEGICRVCHCGYEVAPLFYPCKCKGSIEFVHEDCLVKWLRVSRKRRCELCLTEFSFASVYSEDAPVRLSFARVLFGSLRLAMGLLPRVGRFVWVGLLWFGALPSYTSRIHALLFARKLHEISSAVSNFDVLTFIHDTLFGLVLTGTIVSSLLMLIVLQDITRKQESSGSNDAPSPLRESSVLSTSESAPTNISNFAGRFREMAVACATDANDLVEELHAAAEENVRLFEIGSRILVDHVSALGDAGGPQELEDSEVFDDIGDEIVFDESENPEVIETVEEIVNGDTENRVEEVDFEWDVVVGIRGKFYRGLTTVLFVALSNTAFLLLFQFLPYTIGRAVLYGLENDIQIFDPEWIEGLGDLCLWQMVFGRSILLRNWLIMAVGYASAALAGLVYLVLRKLWGLLATAISASRGMKIHVAPDSTPDLVQQYISSIISAFVHFLSLFFVVFMELFFLRFVVGLVSHLGIMGMSGTFTNVFQTRYDKCESSPFTCIALHWAVGCVIIVNWTQAIWAFRQVIHPRFRLWFFGWNDYNNAMETLRGIRDPYYHLFHSSIFSRNSARDIVRSLSGKRSFFSRGQNLRADESPVRFQPKFSPLDQAPFPVQGACSHTGDLSREAGMISQSIGESWRYVVTVILWSVPAVAIFLLCPIEIIKYFMPSVFPPRLGNLREPFTDAQRPLDIFLFHSIPYVVEKLKINKALLNGIKVILNRLSTPLDLHGYVLRPQLEHMKTGFVNIDQHSNLENVGKSRKEKNPSVGGMSFRRCSSTPNITALAPMVVSRSALPYFPQLSGISCGNRVDVYGVVVFTAPYSKFCVDYFQAKITGESTVYAFSVADSLGYCVPVFLDLALLTEGVFLKSSKRNRSAATRFLYSVKRFIGVLDSLGDPDSAEHANTIRKKLFNLLNSKSDTFRGHVIEFCRFLFDEVQDRNDLLNILIEFLPDGFGAHWGGGKECSIELFAIVSDLMELWSDGNLPQCLMLRQALVCSISGRSLLLDANTSIVMEPDCDGIGDVLNAYFESRLRSSPAAGPGQFCVLRHTPSRLGFRLFLFGMVTCLAAVVACVHIFLLPLLAGRLVFHALGDFLENDLYYWGGGCLILWALACFSLRFYTTAASYRRDGGPNRALSVCLCWTTIALKWTLALVVFGIVLPLLLGLLCELTFFDRFGLYFKEVTSSLVLQDWGLGLAGLKVWTQLVDMGLVGGLSWARRLNHAYGIISTYDIDINFLLRLVALPLIRGLLMRICVPYICTLCIVYFMRLDAVVADRIFHTSHPVFCTLLFLPNFFSPVKNCMDWLHDLVRDNQYIIGTKLQNLKGEGRWRRK